MKPAAALAIQRWRRIRAAADRGRTLAPEDLDTLAQALAAFERGESFGRALGLGDTWRASLGKAAQDRHLATLRAQGLTYSMIVERTGMDPKTIRAAVRREKTRDISPYEMGDNGRNTEVGLNGKNARRLKNTG